MICYKVRTCMTIPVQQLALVMLPMLPTMPPFSSLPSRANDAPAQDANEQKRGRSTRRAAPTRARIRTRCYSARRTCRSRP